jgi:hypothetical protein
MPSFRLKLPNSVIKKAAVSVKVRRINTNVATKAAGTMNRILG